LSVTVLAFARLRELLGFSQRPIDLSPDATVGALWDALLGMAPAIGDFRATTRIAQNGAVVGEDAALHEGDEIALLPPVSGG